MKSPILKLVIFLTCLCFSSFLHAEIAVVVLVDSSVELMNEQQVANVFLSKTNRLSNGEKAVPLEVRDSQLRTEFYRHITNKTATQLKSYWTTLIFTGKGKPPKSFTNKNELLEYMESHTGSIAYVQLSEVTPEMKVIYRTSVD